MSQKNLNSNIINKYIGCKIIDARKKQGITQQSLANFLGVSRIAMSSYETGRTRIAIPHLVMLSKALGKPIEYFIEEIFEGIKEKKKIKVQRFDLDENIEFELEMSLRNYLKHKKTPSGKANSIITQILKDLNQNLN